MSVPIRWSARPMLPAIASPCGWPRIRAAARATCGRSAAGRAAQRHAPASLLQIDWQRRQLLPDCRRHRHHAAGRGGAGAGPPQGRTSCCIMPCARARDAAYRRCARRAAWAIASSSMPATRAARLDLAGAVCVAACGTVVLFCGPMRMLEAARSAWAACGRAAQPISATRRSAPAAASPRSRFASASRRPARSSSIPRDRSMLDVLCAAGHDMISDCRRGECGVCAVDVVDVDGADRSSRRLLQRRAEARQPQDLPLRLARARAWSRSIPRCGPTRHDRRPSLA